MSGNRLYRVTLAGELYRGWTMYDNGAGSHPITGRWFAKQWGVRIGTTTRDGLIRMIDQRIADRESFTRPMSHDGRGGR